MASTTFVFDALHAGQLPDMAPVKNANNKQPIIRYIGIAACNNVVPI